MIRSASGEKLSPFSSSRRSRKASIGVRTRAEFLTGGSLGRRGGWNDHHWRSSLHTISLPARTGGGGLTNMLQIGRKAITHSILMRSRSRTVRYIRAIHDLDCKTIHLRSAQADRKL